jgi:hypothetical protein
MSRFTFQCGNGSTMMVEAETVEEAIQKLFTMSMSIIGYYEQI